MGGRNPLKNKKTPRTKGRGKGVAYDPSERPAFANMLLKLIGPEEA